MKMPDGKTFDTDLKLVNKRRFRFSRKRRNYWATRNPDEFIPCSRIEPFSYLVECRLILAAQGGNTVARNQVWEQYARVVLSVANELYIPRHLLEDAIQEGLIGLCRAIIAFDVASLDTFSEFSRMYIRRQIQRFLFAFSFRAKIPSNWFYEYCRFATGLHKCVSQQMENQYIVALQNQDFDNCKFLLTIHKAVECCSIEHDVDISQLTELYNVTSSNDALTELVANAVQQLPAAQREILVKRFGLAGSQRHRVNDLAAELGTNRVAVWRAIQRAQDQLEKILRECYSQQLWQSCIINEALLEPSERTTKGDSA